MIKSPIKKKKKCAIVVPFRDAVCRTAAVSTAPVPFCQQ